MFRIFLVFICWLLLGNMYGCHSANTSAPATVLTSQQRLQQNIDTLKAIARDGDLLVRLTDDIVSQQITGMNEREKLYSHGGLIVQKQGKNYVYHIAPALPGADTIQIEPLDSFINPQKNIRCALFRYQLSAAEREALMQAISDDKANDVRFDMVYDLDTNDKLYCSEMISKALTTATKNRMQFRATNAPLQMQKVLFLFLKKQHITKEIIATRKFISLDNLYLRPDCEELMRFDLKIFPGQ